MHRAPGRRRPTALRRALANRIENAAEYGERARVALLPADDLLVARAHGGDIALRNRPEGGLRVEARLPR